MSSNLYEQNTFTEIIETAKELKEHASSIDELVDMILYSLKLDETNFDIVMEIITNNIVS